MEACASAVNTKFHVVGLKKSTDWGSPERLARQLITQSGQSDGHDDLYDERNSLRRKCVKSKLPVHAIKACRREWRYSSTHSTSALHGSEWSIFRPRPFYPRKKTRQYPLNKRLGGPQSQSRRYGEEIYLLRMPGFEGRIVETVAKSL